MTAIEAVGRAGADLALRHRQRAPAIRDGCIANVTASRISRDRVRKIRFFQPDAYISIDYAAQEVEGYRLIRRDGERPDIQGGQLPVTREEPLKRELEDFVGAVRDRRPPLVTGDAGRRALALAQAIADKMTGI